MMKKIITITLLLTVGVITGVSMDRYLSSSPGENISASESAMSHAKKHLDPNYVCPMHSQIVSGEQGTCPICGMDLVKIKTQSNAGNSDDDSDDLYPTVRVSSTMINNMGVRVALVTRKTLIRQIETPGFITRILPASYSRYNAPAKGRIVKFHFKPGQWNKKGDPLIDIALDDLVLVQEKHLELLTKEAQQKKTKEDESKEDESREALPKQEKPIADFVDTGVNDETADILKETSRDKSLTESPLVASDEATDEATDDTTTDVIVTEKKSVQITTKRTRYLMQAAGMTEAQMTTLEQTKVTSPIITLYANHAGEVKKLRVAIDDKVKANAMLFTVGGLMKVTVLANAFQRDASWVKPGQDVDIILPHNSNKPWKGRVSSGAVSINVNSQNIGVDLVFNAPDGVAKSGMYVVGNIYGQVREDTLIVPRDAIIYSHNEKRVIVALGEGRFKPVLVEIGISNDNEVEILKGVEEGDTIVVSAQFLIDSESSLQASYRRMTSIE